MEWMKLKALRGIKKPVPVISDFLFTSFNQNCPSDYQKPLTFYDSLFLKFYMTNKCLKQIEQYLIKEI